MSRNLKLFAAGLLWLGFYIVGIAGGGIAWLANQALGLAHG